MTGTGTIARDNPFRFSTKRTDDTTDLVLYEYRPYSPSLGRWPSRDPIGEKGGLNLYGFAGNNPVMRFDRDGRITGVEELVVGGAVVVIGVACYAIPACREAVINALKGAAELVKDACKPRPPKSPEKCDKIKDEIVDGASDPVGGLGTGDFRPPERVCRYKCKSDGLTFLKRLPPEGQCDATADRPPGF